MSRRASDGVHSIGDPATERLNLTLSAHTPDLPSRYCRFRLKMTCVAYENSRRGSLPGISSLATLSVCFSNTPRVSTLIPVLVSGLGDFVCSAPQQHSELGSG